MEKGYQRLEYCIPSTCSSYAHLTHYRSVLASYRNQSFVLQSKANDSFYMKLRTELKLVNFLVKLKKLIICVIVKWSILGVFLVRISSVSLRIQSECWKILSTKTPNTDTSHAMNSSNVYQGTNLFVELATSIHAGRYYW